MKEITKLKFVFCVDDNLLIYFKIAILRINKAITVENANELKINSFTSDAFDSDSSDNEKFLIHSILFFQ